MPHTPLELATAFISTGELDDALNALNQHLSASPEDDAMRRMRIETLLRMRGEESLQQALADLQTLNVPVADDYARQSVVYERLHQLDNAVHAMNAALELAPDNERLIERLIYLLQAQGDFSTAIGLLKDLPHTWRWREWAGDLAAQAGASEVAIEAYTDALSLLESHAETLSPTYAQPLKARLLLVRAQVYRVQNQFEAAKADFTAAGELISDDLMIVFLRGLTVLLTGDFANAERLCREAYQQANVYLQQAMRHELESDVRCAELARKVLE